MLRTSQARLFRIPFVYVFASLTVLSSTAQTPALPASRSTDVVILSLSELDNSGAEHRKHVRDRLDVNSDMDVGFDALFKAQVEIILKTAPFGPVLLIAPDEETKTIVYQNCKELELCDLFRSDRVRMKVVAHEGVWGRDFGPQIEITPGGVQVVHWRYFDNRSEEARVESLEKLDNELSKLFELKAGLLKGEGSGLSAEISDDQKTNALKEVDAELNFLRDYAQFLRQSSLQRHSDESSAYDFADAILEKPNFRFISSEADVDGGNLMKLDDGRCLTTRVLLTRNKDVKVDAVAELQTKGGCKDVIFLDPLPGPVIEHVDMFVLPAGGRRILVASYNFSEQPAKKHFSELSDSEKYLTLNAALAMDRNAERLTKLGYEVVRVQSPFPRTPEDEGPYYPTALNALVRSGSGGNRQVVMPVYKNYEEDIQAIARQQIQAAFGNEAEIATVESTEIAKAQGAVHCLTLTAPLSVSVFGDPADQMRRRQYLAVKDSIDQAQAQEAVAQIPATGEQGLWVMLEEGERESDEKSALYPKIHFAQNAFELGLFDETVATGQYEIQKEEPNKWRISLKYRDGDSDDGVLEWLSGDRVKLVLSDAEKTYFLKQLNTDPAVPFEVAKESQDNKPEPAPHHRQHQKKPASPKAKVTSTALNR